MKKIITINDPMQVEVGDKAYFKDCDFGFTVVEVERGDHYRKLSVNNPLSGYVYWAVDQQFDHATREVEEPEWPDPHDAKLHVYLGADGDKYLYMPTSEYDTCPWRRLPNDDWRDAEEMTGRYPTALPLTELKLVLAKDDNNEQ